MSRHEGEYIPSSLFLSQGGEKTFEHDDKLPSLPVPDLDSTLNKYLESAIPHLSATERLRTERAIERFRRNEGPELQQMLQNRAKTHRNWLADWWLSYAYLKLRIPIAPFVNVCGMAPYEYHYWPPKEGSQLYRNALSLYFLLTHWQHMRREELRGDFGKGGKEPWSMHQFRHLYNCCRVPGLEEDSISTHFKTVTEGDSPTHIVVLCNRRIYKVNVVTAKGDICTPFQLQHILTQIKADAKSKPPGIGISSMTTADRPTWYHIREHLISLSNTNKEHLETIQSAIITDCLLDGYARNMEQMAQQGLLGKPGNVWCGKSYNSLWFSDGTTASNCDHGPMDAMTQINLCFYVDCKVIECKGLWEGPKGDLADCPPYTELEFKVDQRVIEAIEEAENQYLAVVNNVEIIHPEFHGIGKTLLKEHRLHPDTFVQVCLQYGYYKLHGRSAPTYETATTRKFYQGRTETVRSCTNEAVLFAKTMLDPRASVSHKLQLFKQAMAKHHSLMKECMEGQGIDRHLLGLKILAAENGLPTPDIFTDDAYEKSGGNGNYTLSTSFVGFTSVLGGVVPMRQDGYGFFYRIGTERMVFFITSWRSDPDTSAVKLYETVKECMLEVMSLVTNNSLSAL